MTSWYHFFVDEVGGTPNAPFAAGPAISGIITATLISLSVTPGADPGGETQPLAVVRLVATPPDGTGPGTVPGAAEASEPTVPAAAGVAAFVDAD